MVFPLIQDRVSRSTFSDVLGKIHSRLASWKGRLLNRAGRICLARSVLASLPIHTMQVLWLPTNVCHAIDSTTRRFIWSGREEGRSFNLVNWKILTRPRRFGGLSIRDSRIANVALLGKLAWKILCEPHKPWVQVLSHIYLSQSHVLDSYVGKGSSYVWRSIKKALNFLREGWQFRLRSGRSSFWYDNWSSIGRLCDHVPYVHISETELQVKDLWTSNGWCFDYLLPRLFQIILEFSFCPLMDLMEQK